MKTYSSCPNVKCGQVVRETQDMIQAGLYGINDISQQTPVPAQSVSCGQTLELESLGRKNHTYFL